MIANYLTTGIEITVAMSLIAGIFIGSVMGIAGFGSIWVFRAEMISLFVAGAAILVVQSALIVKAAASQGVKAGVAAGVLFFLSEPIAGLVAASTAIAVAYGLGKITGKWKTS
jgi:hypothetical protein